MKSRVAEVLLVILRLMWSADPTLEEPVTNLWYFKPRPSDACPAGVIDEQCLVFSQMLQNVTILEQVFTSNVGLIFLSGDHIIKLPNEGYLTYRDVENVTILGTPERRTTQIGIPGPASKIVCQLPFTFIFANITRLAFHNVTISGCGATVNSATLAETFFVQTRGIHTFGVGQRMALLLVNIRNFTMTRCLLENNLGYGLLGVNILGVSQVLGSVFVLNNNYTVGRMQCTRPPSSQDDITACSGGNALFVYEDLLECPTSPLQYVLIIRSSLFAFGVSGFGGRLNDYFLTRGGTGIGIIMAQSSYGVTVELDTVSSFGNAALVGANIYVALYDVVDNSSVLIQNTRSMNANGGLNTLVAESGSASAGLHVDYGLPFVTPTTLRPICPTDRKFFQEEIVSIVNSRFTGNTALLGSGAYFEVRVGVGGAPDHGDSIIRFRLDRCVFLNNVGISGIALYYSQQNGLGAGNSELVLNNVQFINNSYIEPIRNLTELYTSYQLNVLQFISARNVTIQDCIVSSSEASALSAFGSNIVMRGQLLFDGNSGINGGALDLQDSRIGLLPNTQVTFTNNYASRYGGAMHITGRSDVLLPCFFQVHDPSFLPDPNITLYFKNNYAEDAGSVLYGGTVDRCLVSADSAFQANTSTEVFNYLADIRAHSSATSVISSDPFRVCFCFNGAPDCNRTFINITKFPGATVEIPVVNTGQRLGTTPSSVFVIPSKSAKIRNDQQVQQVQKVCTNINLTLTSTQLNTATVDLQTNLLAITSKVTINMQLLECPLGFILSNKTGACECDPISQSQIFNISCNIDQQTISRVAGSWINASYLGPNGTYNGILVLGSCPYDYCLRQASNVNLVDPDMQCNFNRTGVLCGACKDGLSLTLATSKCTACSNAGIALFLGYIVAAFGLLCVLFALDMTISSGTLSGLIFYGNIIHIHQSVYFPPGSYNIITVFIAWLNLDSGLDFCLYDGFDAYARIWLGFVFPIYIWILVIIIIVASRYSSKLARITGLKPVSVLATLILLSYNKLLNVSISALSFASILEPDGKYKPVWLLDGNIDFFEGRHIPLGLFAMVVVLLFVIPYTLFLVIVPLPWVQARSTSKWLSWINTLKPFLDAHQGPFKRFFRNWIGILLLARAFLATLSSFTVGEYDPENLILAIVVMMVLLLTWVAWINGGVYSKRSRNILESSFYLNLGFVTVMTLYARTSVVASQHSIILTSGWVALLEFLGIICYHLLKRLDSIQIFQTMKKKMLNMLPKKTVKSNQELSTTNTYIGPTPTTTYVNIREPLLDDNVV